MASHGSVRCCGADHPVFRVGVALGAAVGFPRMIGTWLGFAEQLALVVAGVMAYAFLAPGNPLWAVRSAHSVAVQTPATSGLKP